MDTTETDGGAAQPEDGGWVLLLTAAHDVRAVPLADGATVVIGRDPGCDVALDHERISRRHTRIAIGTSWTVEDLGSRNGTLVNGVVARGQVPFGPGEPIAIGPFTAVVVPRAVSAVRAVVGASSVSIEDPTLAHPAPLVVAIARSTVSIVIHGETGAGKEVLSRALHELSGRPGPLLAINCAALAPQLLESELFGHEKGAFTGAVGKPGLLEAAARGTVLLDEIAELPLELQAKLLRAIEAREVMRVGSVKPQAIDVRFIAASHRDLMSACAAGTFRRDLFYRLAGITLTVAPLRDRRHQIAALASRFARQALGGETTLSPSAVTRLTAHDWPGNVRELKNVVERAVLLAAGAPIDDVHLLFDLAPPATPRAAPAALTPAAAPMSAAAPTPAPSFTPAPEHDSAERDSAERDRIVAALEACAGNQTQAARRLGISRATLVHKLDVYRVPRPRRK